MGQQFTDEIDPNDDIEPEEGFDEADEGGEGEEGEPRERVSRSASRTLRRERAKVRALEAKINELTNAMKSGGIGTEAKKDTVDIDAMRRQLMEEVTAKVEGDANARILVTEAKSLLKEAGFNGRAERGVRLLDLADIDVKSGRVDEDALLDAIEDLKEESPGLFARGARTNRESRDTGRSRRRPNDDDEDDERDSSTRRTRRTEGMTRERGGGSNMDSLERALRQMVGAPRNRE